MCKTLESVPKYFMPVEHLNQSSTIRKKCLELILECSIFDEVLDKILHRD